MTTAGDDIFLQSLNYWRPWILTGVVLIALLVAFFLVLKRIDKIGQYRQFSDVLRAAPANSVVRLSSDKKGVHIRVDGRGDGGRAVLPGLEAFRMQADPSHLAGMKRRLITSMGPQSYYYLDTNQIEDLYSEVIQSLPARSREVEEERSRGGEVSAKLKIVDPKLTRGVRTKTVEKFEEDLTLTKKYSIVRSRLFESSAMVFGAEDVPAESDFLPEIEGIFVEIESILGSGLPGDTGERLVAERKRKIGQERLDYLRSATGHVALHGEFLVTRNTPADEQRILLLDHPLNEYLDTAPRASIKISCDDAYFRSGAHIFQDGTTIRVTCVGKVLSWNEADRVLTIIPMALS